MFVVCSFGSFCIKHVQIMRVQRVFNTDCSGVLESEGFYVEGLGPIRVRVYSFRFRYRS